MTSTIKVNNIQNQCGQNIINENSNTITIGASGDTIALASGASQTGFGRTGTVNWVTTVKTGDFTAASGEGYFINTTSGAITMTLPSSPSAGDIVAFKDYANTFDTNNLTIARNGSKIGGDTVDATVSVEGQAATLIFIDATQGWLVTNAATDSDLPRPAFIVATGGTIKTSGNFKTHIFTGPGTFCVSAVGTPTGSDKVDFFVVGAGGGGGSYGGGGGGAGGFRVSNSGGCVPAPTMSPLIAPACSPGRPVSVQGYPITVGAGGAGGTGPNNPGAPNTSTENGQVGTNSVFSTITSARGGGGSGIVNCWAGSPLSGGGSGGGSKGSSSSPGNQPGNGYPGGSGNTPPTSPPQGNPGGKGYDGRSISTNGGGGGGAGAVGATTCTQDLGAAGGAGSFVADAFIGGCAPSFGSPGPVSSTRYFSGGGGGGTDGGNCRPAATGGAGGDGGGGPGGKHPGVSGTAGTVNTGGGGGGAGSGSPSNAGAGGSGIVMIRYKFQ
jgi:hypothetical protein